MAKKASKGKSAKMPKKIGDTKVPKEVRSAGDMLASLVTSPMARELVADALIAVAGVLAGNKKTREAVAGAGAEAASGAKEIGQTAPGPPAETDDPAPPPRPRPAAPPPPHPALGHVGGERRQAGQTRRRGCGHSGQRPQEAQGHAGPA